MGNDFEPRRSSVQRVERMGREAAADQHAASPSEKPPKTKLEIQWDTWKADDVMRNFVRQYEGGMPEDFEWYFDVAKQTILFKLFIRVEDKS